MILLSWGCDKCGDTKHVEVSWSPGVTTIFWADHFRIPTGWKVGNERTVCSACVPKEASAE